MTATQTGFILPAMARREAQPKTDQINFRLPVPLIERMEAYKDRHPLHPTLTSIVVAAVTDWLEANESNLPPPRKPPKH